MSSFIASEKFTCESALNERTQALLQEITDYLLSHVGSRPEAIVLTGSFARGEGSVLLSGRRLRVLGDMEFMVVFPPGAERTGLQRRLDNIARELGQNLAAREIDCELEFRAVCPDYFRALRPQIFGYELLSCGRTLWGDANILASVSCFPASSVPRWDAWRMLHNRILDQLEAVEAAGSKSADGIRRSFYQLVKFHLDIGTTLLVFAGRYQATYQGRARALHQWAAETSQDDSAPFLREIARRVEECTAFKLSPTQEASPLGVDFASEDVGALRESMRRAALDLAPLAHAVWRWEAGVLANRPTGPGTDDSTLWDAVLRQQALWEKLRGWAKLLLMPETRRQPGFPARMLRLLRVGSPRYLVYRVAAHLYFELPNLLADKKLPQELLELERLLPAVFPPSAGGKHNWRELNSSVLAGWRLFLRNHWA